MNNIYLCGFLSHNNIIIGKEIARKLNWQFIDLDDFMQKRAKCSPIELLDIYGIDGRRNILASALEEVCLMKNTVVAVGEITFSYEKNIIIAKNSGKIVYLLYHFRDCYNKINGHKHRNSPSKLTDENICDTLHKRHTIYKICANYIYEPIHSTKYSAKSIISLILK